MTVFATMSSPLGELLLVGERTPTGVSLTSVSMPGQRGGAVVDASWERAPFTEAVSQLTDYFAGDLKEFDLEFTPSGSAFQREVWAALENIPYGETTSYGAINKALGGSPARARAIGRAIGANPLLIVRPCHRVVGADGALTGYAGGLPAKETLLTLEGALLG